MRILLQLPLLFLLVCSRDSVAHSQSSPATVAQRSEEASLADRALETAMSQVDHEISLEHDDESAAPAAPGCLRNRVTGE